MQTPLILVTNDDGVHAPGIRALHEAVGSLGRAVIVAPERDNSAVSHALTMNRPLRVVELESDVYTIDGALVAQRTATDTERISLSRGMYIVKVAGVTYKVLVK